MQVARIAARSESTELRGERPALQLAASDAWFVGRDRELAALTQAIEGGAARIWVTGGTGVGKTKLLAALVARCREQGTPYHWLAPHEPATPAVLSAIADELSRAVGARDRRRVLVIDDFAALRPVELWFVERFLPALPPSVTVVAADRAASPIWRDGDPRSHVLALGPLADADARAYLRLRGVADDLWDDAVAHAEGIPAILAALADAAGKASSAAPTGATAGAGGGAGNLGAFIGVIDERLRFYTRHATDEQRLAIAVLAAARTTPYELLELAFDHARAARDAFAWLSRLTIVEHTPHGLRPHTVLRKACERELADHAAALWDRARRAVRVFSDHRIAVARDPARWLLDRLFVDRDHAAVRAHLALPAVEPALAIDAATPADRPALAALIAGQHRDRAAAALASWLEDERAVFDVLRDPASRVCGYVCHVVLTATSQTTGRDPLVELCASHLRAAGWFGLATPPDARALVCRDWTIAGDQRAASPGAALAVSQIACRLLTTPAVDYHFLVTDRQDVWLRALEALGLEPIIVGTQRVGGVAMAAIVTDWRQRSVPRLLQQVTDAAPATTSPTLAVPRQVGRGPGAPHLPPPTSEEARALADALARRTAQLAREASLSPREHEVLELLLLGRNCAEIGVALDITARTARFHQHNVLHKLGAESRLDILRLLL